jgi:hypothetical protein
MRERFVKTSVPAARPIAASLIAGALTASALGCGTGKTYQNNPRPPQPIVVAAAITPGGITVSPSTFGAGLIQLVVSNLTTSSQQLEVVSRGAGSPVVQQQTGPINPQDTAQLKANLGPGAYNVRVADTKVKSAVLKVGATRASSQNQLLQP